METPSPIAVEPLNALRAARRRLISRNENEVATRDAISYWHQISSALKDYDNTHIGDSRLELPVSSARWLVLNSRETKSIFTNYVSANHHTRVLSVAIEFCKAWYIIWLVEADMDRTVTEEPYLAFLCGECQ